GASGECPTKLRSRNQNWHGLRGLRDRSLTRTSRNQEGRHRGVASGLATPYPNSIMSMMKLVERYRDEIAGVLSCVDWLMLQGRIGIFSYADGMTRYLTARGIKIFDFIKWAGPATEALKKHVEGVAAQAGLVIDFVRKKNFRKEQRIEEVLKKRGRHPGLAWSFCGPEP